MLVVLLLGVAHGFPHSTNDILPEDSQLSQMEAAIATDDDAALSVSDRAMQEIMENADAEDTEVKTAAPAPKPKMATSSTEVHDAIVRLKAYSINVYLKAQNIDEGHSKARMTGSSIVPFLIAFGKDNSVSTKSKSGGVVAEYAELMGKAIKQYDMGLGNYMLTKLNSAVLEGRNVLTVEKVDGKTEYTIAWDTLGLQSQPKYMKTLGSPAGEMMATKVRVSEANQGADTKAAVGVVTAKHNAAFKVFYTAELKKSEQARKVAEENIAAASYVATQEAFKQAKAKDSKTKLLHVAVQSTAALDAANEAEKKDPKLRQSTASMKAAAEAEAKKGDAAVEKSVGSTAKTVEVLEAQAAAKVTTQVV